MRNFRGGGIEILSARRGLDFLEEGLRYFLEWGCDIFRGGEKFPGGVEQFSGGLRNFQGCWEIFRAGEILSRRYVYYN